MRLTNGTSINCVYLSWLYFDIKTLTPIFYVSLIPRVVVDVINIVVDDVVGVEVCRAGVGLVWEVGIGRRGADQFVVGNGEVLEVGVVHEAVGVEVGLAGQPERDVLGLIVQAPDARDR